MQEGPHDATLLAATAQGDDAAFSQLMRRYIDPLHHYCWRLCGSKALADDVCQDAWLKVWQSADRFSEKRGTAKAWIYKIAYNTFVDRYRDRSRRDAVQTELTAELEREQQSGTASEELIEQIALSKALTHLPHRQAAAIVLVYQHGFSQAEAASALGVRVRALESLLARGKRKLTEVMSTGAALEGSRMKEGTQDD